MKHSKTKQASHATMRGRDFLSVDDFSPREIQATFKLAQTIKAFPRRFRRTLDGTMMALIFEKPSLRTRTTFTVGIKQLGGDAILLTPADINLGKRESVFDVAKNLERMIEGIMIRTFGHDICASLAEYASVPVINGLTDYEHPCQALADYFTISEFKKKWKTARVSYIGDGNNVAHSLLFTAAKLGLTFTIATPEGYEPDDKVLQRVHELALGTGASILSTRDPIEAARDADVIYTDTWTSMGQEDESERRRKIFRPYQINRELFSHAKPDALFMHCLPAHRGEEVTDEIMDSPNSVVFQQAENRLHVQKAIMVELLRGRP